MVKHSTLSKFRSVEAPTLYAYQIWYIVRTYKDEHGNNLLSIREHNIPFVYFLFVVR